jgi:cell division ATPase FtsA
MKTVGIDLGTTNSVVAIAEARQGKGFFITPKCPSVSVITDKLDRKFQPSVVAVLDERGNHLVGDSAKARAGMEPPPIMFAKRWMGEEHPFNLGRYGILKPEDVSARVLAHLKKIAEEQLGETVEEAVITVPAYFNTKAKQMTGEAAKLVSEVLKREGGKAKLNVKQLALEPVAAALMYCSGESRDPLTIMTYDLGGGTFDVAIMEKKDGFITSDSIISFDGNPKLGGYNFDRKIAFWMVEQLNSKGYDLDLDLSNPRDNVIFAKLMVIAEETKIKLSKKEVVEIQEPASTSGIKDHAGESVELAMQLTRDQFEDMIHDEIEETIKISQRTLTKNEKRKLTPAQIDEIVMVGGSSRIPLVTRRIQETFGKTPLLVEPDLCVGIGAAIIAGAPLPVFGHLQIKDIPEETDRRDFTVTGSVEAGRDLAKAEGCRITLRSDDGSVNQSRTVAADGKFAFVRVPLVTNAVTAFKVSGTSPSGKDIGVRDFSVRQVSKVGISIAKPKTTRIPDVVARPIGVMMRDGAHVIAPAGTQLPFSKEITARRGDSTAAIRIPILDDNAELGVIVMDVPVDLPVGSEVRIKVNLRGAEESFKIQGEAFVPAIQRNADVDIDLPLAKPKPLSQLRRDYELLVSEADDLQSSASAAVTFDKADEIARLQDILEQLERMFRDPDPDPSDINQKVSEGQTLVKSIGGSWKPSPTREEFDAKAQETNDEIEALHKEKPQTQKDGYDQQLDAIRGEASKAYAAQDQAQWELSFKNVVGLCDRVHKARGKKGGDGPPPPPGLVLLQLGQELSAVQNEAKKKDTLRGREAEFEDAAKSLREIKPDEPEHVFWGKVRDWYHTKLQPLKEGTGYEDPGKKGLTDWID